MTEKDKELIRKAEEYNYGDWGEVADLIEEAESEECRKRLHDRMVWLYHREEYYCGIL